MADPYSQTGSVKPTGPSVDATQHITPVHMPAVGQRTAEAIEGLGQNVIKIGDLFGDVAADNASNEYQERVNAIMHGAPGRMVTGPDGKPTPDLGYMGLKGRAALDARAETDKRMDDLRKEMLGKMTTLRMRKAFDDTSRRYKTYAEGRMGQHADAQANLWYDQVDKAGAENWSNHIARNANDPQQVLEGRENLRKVYVQRAERLGGGPAMITQAVEHADRVAVEAQASSIAVTDPSKAMRIIENNKAALGTRYDELALRFRARAEQQDGRELADGMLSASPPPKGDDAHAVVKHFEGFLERPKMDTDGRLRAGYGSDTVTKADGTVAPVTADTVVTREDAERDLARRVPQFQAGIKQKIGNEKWDALSPQAQASLTSIAYNYGSLPDGVAEAVRSGGDIAAAIRKLAGHNNGINASRRAREANNIAPGEAIPRSQVEMIEEVKARGLPPQAEAAAVARINRSYELQHKVETQQRAAFKQKVDDSTAEAMQTGVTSNPVPEADFLRHYGPADGAAKYAEYKDDIVFGADWKSLQTLSDVDQHKLLDARMPKPGAPGYAHAIKSQERLQKAVAKIQEQRRDDPAGAVSRMPAVQDAFALYDPKNPGSFKAVADARLAAQERLGIDPEFRSPITKAEALKLTAPLRNIIAGDTRGIRDSLTRMGTQFKAMFGDQADEAFAYAIRAHKVDAEVSQQAALVFRKIANGEALLPADGAAVDGASERAAAKAAITGTGRPQPARPRVIGNPDEQGFEGSPVIQPQAPPPGAIEYLLKNPGSDAAFDQKYGTGLAKEIRKRYPVAPGLP